MTAQVTLTLSDQMLARAAYRARAQQQELGQTIAEFLENNFPLIEYEKPITHDRSAQLRALDHEKEAYLRLHPRLKQTHWGRYVAIYQGVLIDDDTDFGTLIERVRSHLPNEIVWISLIEEEPIPTIRQRSPRFERTRV